MSPEEVELGRAAIAYLSYRLLLTYRVKRGNVRGNPGGWVGVRHYENEIRKEIARLLDIHVDYDYKYVDEMKRLYRVMCDSASRMGSSPSASTPSWRTSRNVTT